MEELRKKAAELFKKYDNQNTLYAIDNGNFWFQNKESEAKYYAKKLHKEVFTFKREDFTKPLKNKVVEIPVEDKTKDETFELSLISKKKDFKKK